MAASDVLTTLGFAAGASLPLVAGALAGSSWRPPRPAIATSMAFAAGALISALAFELFEVSYELGGPWRAALGFAAGTVVFVVLATLLKRAAKGPNPTGLALLVAVTLDGIPENVALGVTLTTGGSIALLLAVFVSNFPEALVGAAEMRERGRPEREVIALWSGAAGLLFVAVVLGDLAFSGVSNEQLVVPLGFAAGAVLASVIDTLAPEAYREGGPFVALASAAGFFLAFMLSVV